jgi:hypothetical protein
MASSRALGLAALQLPAAALADFEARNPAAEKSPPIAMKFQPVEYLADCRQRPACLAWRTD